MINKLTDYHCHFLPAIDDGAKNKEISFQMLKMLKNQGVERVIATPHFYAHREKSVEHFLEKRQCAYEKIKDFAEELSIEIVLGAEISIENGISELPNIEKLAFSGTDLILLEPSYFGYDEYILDEVYAISCEYKLTPIIAHVHRYEKLYSKTNLEKILELNAIFQINNEAFEKIHNRRFIKKLVKNNQTIIFGSDAHNLDSRKPNFDFLQKKIKIDRINKSNKIFEEHRLSKNLNVNEIIFKPAPSF